MARTTAARARQDFARLLDAAERGEEVVVERRGVRFRIVAERAAEAPVPSPEPLLVADAAVLAGEWHWETGPGGELGFVDDRAPR